MSTSRLANWRRSLVALFPERHLYIRSGGEMRGYVLTTQKQLMAAGVVAFAALWLGVSTAAMVINALAPSSSDQRMVAMQARYERLIADREARLISYNTSHGSIEDLANSVERQHAALAMLLNDLRGDGNGARDLALAANGRGSGSPQARIEAVRADQERLITAAETSARSRAERLRAAFRLAGLNPSSFTGGEQGRGGPLIEDGDPRALAAVLDVDAGFASRIQRAAANMNDLRALNEAAREMPLGRPTMGAEQTSGFGVRFDPFTGHPAFHSGLDFAGAANTPIYATAPGVVSFTGVRQGYGNCIEIDHGGGFKTRFAHLRTISVVVGQRVGVGTRIGGMGSTGRSTGTHLHYEIWVNGRAQNPIRFVRAGDYVQQTH
jgi:murein DD-endopeptidase MepM/ murein hydrolase activator NlpD